MRSAIQTPLIWLGGGDQRELDEHHARATHSVAGVVVLTGAVLAWLVAAAATSTPWPGVLAVTLPFGVLIGAVMRAIAGGRRSRLGRVAVGVAIGAVVAELASLAILAGPIQQQLELQAARDADAAPAVTRAAADVDRARSARAALDAAVDRAREQRDAALVVARCEYHPTPECPQTHITGVPGTGPETRTANDLLADAQSELDRTVTTRQDQSPGLDHDVAAAEHALDQAHARAAGAGDHSLGARWIAMNACPGAGPLVLRAVMIVLFALLALLPMLVLRWRGETSGDRRAAARAEVERAELQADTAIAVKHAEVRAAAEILWAEQQLAQARLAVAAQTEIDAERQRRRVLEALDAPIPVASARQPEALAAPVADPEPEMYLPIAAAAEAAAAQWAERPTAALPAVPDRVPAPLEDLDDAVERAAPGTEGIARAAARWIRPLVPPLVARAIETSTAPVRAARHVLGEVFEEVEEITFTLKRTHKVNVQSVSAAEASVAEPQDAPAPTSEIAAEMPARRVRATRVVADDAHPALAERGPEELPAADNSPPAISAR